VAVTETHDLRKLLLGEVIGAKACIEPGETEENRIGTVGDRSLQAIPPSGRGEKIGTQ
jgi:hypothetical protein